MKKLKTIETVRERERESNKLIKLGFNCDAKKIVKNKYIDKIKKDRILCRSKRKGLYYTQYSIFLCYLKNKILILKYK